MHALAYQVSELITAVKGFEGQAPGHGGLISTPLEFGEM
jgi:hypothetical protein